MQRPRTRKDMIGYLTGHFRYDTMNSWNRSTSYAKKIKVHSVTIDGRSLTREEEDACFEMLNVEDSFYSSGFNRILREFGARYHHAYQITSNGRSGGYLVLTQGGERPSEHKSVCTACGQRNFQAVEGPNPGKCGRCNRQTRVNASFPPDVFAYPGKSLDMEEDFQEWSTDDIRDRVELVWEFDQTCDKALKAFLKYALANQVEERVVKVPQKVKVVVKRRKATA